MGLIFRVIKFSENVKINIFQNTSISHENQPDVVNYILINSQGLIFEKLLQIVFFNNICFAMSLGQDCPTKC